MTWRRPEKKCFSNIGYKMAREVIISQKQCSGPCSLGFDITPTLNGAEGRVQVEKEGGEILENTDGGGGHCARATFPGQPPAQPPSSIIRSSCVSQFTKHLPSTATQGDLPWAATGPATVFDHQVILRFTVHQAPPIHRHTVGHHLE